MQIFKGKDWLELTQIQKIFLLVMWSNGKRI